MKGVVLAGGLGTRLKPLTAVTNKHLLPIYDQPMILYPVETLRKSGIEEVIIVCGREHAGHFMRFLGSGKEWGVTLSYALQDTDNGGIADALSYAEDFADGGPVAVVLGDNIFETDMKQFVDSFSGGATAFFKEVSDPQRFGVPVFSEDGKTLVRIEEKPKNPQSSYAQVGFYLLDSDAFSFIKKLAPSARGELEMTDVINMYLKNGKLNFEILQDAWFDAGTFESLFKASEFMRKSRSKKYEN